jgi:alkylation response protein AidB-like acyl-CoA dehydrogenase
VSVIDSVLDFPKVALPSTADALRAEVRGFLALEKANGTVMGRADSWLAGWDRGFSERLGERGWIGMALPKEYGGHERGELERYVVIEELLAAGAPVTAHWIADRQAGPSILRYGTEAQKRRFLPAIASGRCFFSIGMSEAQAGSDLASVQTTAERVSGGWRLTGTKRWTGGAHVNDYAIVLARTEPEGKDRHEGLSQFILDLRAPGVRIEPVKLLSGEHIFNYVYLEGVKVDDDYLLGPEGNGWQQVTGELAWERSGPERFLSTFPLLVAVVREMAGISATPDQQARVGRLVARLHALRQLSIGVAIALQSGHGPDVQAALVKDLGTRFEGEVINEARAILPDGPDPGATPGSYPELLAFATMHGPAFTLRGGTNEILRSIIVRNLEK